VVPICSAERRLAFLWCIVDLLILQFHAMPLLVVWCIQGEALIELFKSISVPGKWL
jgi:hypothetical protein